MVCLAVQQSRLLLLFVFLVFGLVAKQVDGKALSNPYLVKNFKLDSGRVTAMWNGEGNPAARNDTAEGLAKNRRVEVGVIG